MFKLIILFLIVNFVNSTVVEEEDTDNNYLKIYPNCKQLNGKNLCIGSSSNENKNEDCVKEHNCKLLCEIKKSIFSNHIRYCLFVEKNKFPEENLMIGIRIGLQPNLPILETYGVLKNKSKPKFVQTYFYEENNVKKHNTNTPGFEKTKISYNSFFKNHLEFYFICIEQPLKFSIKTKDNQTKNIDLTSDYLKISIFSKNNQFNFTYKSPKYYDFLNYIEFDKKPEYPFTTTQTILLETTTQEILNQKTTTLSTIEETTMKSINKSLDNDVAKTEASKDSSDVLIDKKIIIIFTISIVLIAFFLLVTLSLYNLLL